MISSVSHSCLAFCFEFQSIKPLSLTLSIFWKLFYFKNFQNIDKVKINGSIDWNLKTAMWTQINQLRLKISETEKFSKNSQNQWLNWFLPFLIAVLHFVLNFNQSSRYLWLSQYFENFSISEIFHRFICDPLSCLLWSS